MIVLGRAPSIACRLGVEARALTAFEQALGLPLDPRLAGHLGPETARLRLRAGRVPLRHRSSSKSGPSLAWSAASASWPSSTYRRALGDPQLALDARSGALYAGARAFQALFASQD